MAKFQEIQCPFCGRMVRNTDKFCIFCGSKMQQPTTKPTYTDQERDEIESELKSNMANKSSSQQTPSNKLEEFQIREGSQDDLDDRIMEVSEISKKNEDKSKSGKKSESKIDLPQEIQDQLEAKMKLAIIEQKKSKLKKKLKDLQDDLDEERYEKDMDYSKHISMKLAAFKSIKEELSSEEERIREDLGPKGQFRMDELEDHMEVQRGQLIELKRQFKRRQVKKDIYEQLKLEYSTEFREAEDELQNLRENVIRWLSKEKAEKNRLENRIRLLSARFKSREIDEEEYTTQKADFEKQVENIEERIKILDNYARPRKSRWI